MVSKSYWIKKRTQYKKKILTIASVIPRHIPDPPPVQKRTFPLKISGLKIAVDSTIGTSCGEGDMARTASLFTGEPQCKHRSSLYPWTLTDLAITWYGIDQSPITPSYNLDFYCAPASMCIQYSSSDLAGPCLSSIRPQDLSTTVRYWHRDYRDSENADNDLVDGA